jgi:hypothetical protein
LWRERFPTSQASYSKRMAAMVHVSHRGSPVIIAAMRAEVLPKIIPAVGYFVPGYVASGWQRIGVPEARPGGGDRQFSLSVSTGTRILQR